MLQAAWPKISQRGGVEGESERKEKWQWESKSWKKARKIQTKHAKTPCCFANGEACVCVQRALWVKMLSDGG